MLCYLIAIVLGFFGINVPHLHEATPLGIGISVAIIIIAALNLILDLTLSKQEPIKGHQNTWSGLERLH